MPKQKTLLSDNFSSKRKSDKPQYAYVYGSALQHLNSTIVGDNPTPNVRFSHTGAISKYIFHDTNLNTDQIIVKNAGIYEITYIVAQSAPNNTYGVYVDS